jgi:thiamine-monophosphate kinase
LFTIRQEDYEKIVLNENISVIGYITPMEEHALLISKGGHLHHLTAQGWNAFYSM